ncbi:MBOAT family O-acyltransferase [Orbus sturtevantii]|uniref:MBOAT family O-acyltransferase n=1 Tax=Orbus sturtevantii TaxID=3074109 RepID=UPI00370D67E8
MSYLSIEFSVLFLIFFCLYWSCRKLPVLQNYLLLIASYGIVASFNYTFALILAGYSIVIFSLSFLLDKSKYRRFWFTISIMAAMGNLAVFKYFDFFTNALQVIINNLGLSFLIPSTEIIMPIGISFYTFHSISYIVSIKRKEIERADFISFMLFLSFFPSIVAGPINRARDFLPQIQIKISRELLEPYRAFTLILFAIVKVYWLSSAIADTWVNPVFANPAEYSSLDLIFALYAYAIQLYLNFSGYTDLVTAIALLLGFKLPINFNLPYLASNLRNFWQRWHISLSSWIRDYVYIPLGGSRSGFFRTQINLLIAMLLSGLWHGASLNFLIWGGVHGIGMVLLNIGDKYFGRNCLADRFLFLAKLITFHYVCFAWIFFRSSSFSESLEYLSAIINNFSHIPLHFNSLFYMFLLLLGYYLYPLATNLQVNIVKCMHKVHWSLLPVIFILTLWLVISFAPSGIPNFIYAGF